MRIRKLTWLICCLLILFSVSVPKAVSAGETASKPAAASAPIAVTATATASGSAAVSASASASELASASEPAAVSESAAASELASASEPAAASEPASVSASAAVTATAAASEFTAVSAEESDAASIEASEFAAESAGETEDKIVRVGWYESPFNTIDQYGRRSGYAYAYQRKIAAYTGWKYEYVEGSWSELLDMLKAGEIDLLSDITYTKERTNDMLFPSLPMGTEAFYLYVSPENTDITSDNYESLNGKKVGMARNSIQKNIFSEWAEQHNADTEIVEYSGSEDEALDALLSGQLDAYITTDIYVDYQRALPVWKIGSSDFYFAVNKDRPDILSELDAAMSRIQDENLYYNDQLHSEYLSNSSTEQVLTLSEKEWLVDHGKIRVGYQDGYLAFCAEDESTGKLTGALKDYLEYAATSVENANIEFEAISYPTAAEAMEALEKGEIDCMFPANLTDYDSETEGVVMTPALMRTEMDAVVRASEKKEFVRKEDIVVAVNEGNTNYDMFLADHYPGWQRAYFKDTPAGLEAVAAGEADCVIISNYRFNNIAEQCEDLHLTTLYTGVDMDYCFAVKEGNTRLYSILSRVTCAVPESVINAALTYYSSEDVKVTFDDFLKDNLFLVLAIIAVVLLIILILLLRNIRADKKVHEEEHMLKALNRKVFVDDLTSVRNKGAYTNYIKELDEKIGNEEVKELAIGVFDCDDLKKINDNNGHDKGDIYLKNASRLICRIFQHSPVFRIGGDEFTVVLEHDDLKNREELAKKFEEEQNVINASAENDWDEVHVAIGVAMYDPDLDRSVSDTARRADRMMYENKRLRKLSRCK